MIIKYGTIYDNIGEYESYNRLLKKLLLENY